MKRLRISPGNGGSLGVVEDAAAALAGADFAFVQRRAIRGRQLGETSETRVPSEGCDGASITLEDVFVVRHVPAVELRHEMDAGAAQLLQTAHIETESRQFFTRVLGLLEHEVEVLQRDQQ